MAFFFLSYFNWRLLSATLCATCWRFPSSTDQPPAMLSFVCNDLVERDMSSLLCMFVREMVRCCSLNRTLFADRNFRIKICLANIWLE